MTYTLYYSPSACSMAVHVALNELELNFELVRAYIHKETEDENLKRVNPRGQVPVLVDHDEEDLIILEGGAQLLYLNEKHKGSLLPKGMAARGKAYEWLFFAYATLHSAYARVKFLQKNGHQNGEAMEHALEAIQSHWDSIEKELDLHDEVFICGEDITLADIMIAVIANWSFIPKMPKFGEKTKRMLKAVITRPAFQKALEAEDVKHDLAAE